MAKIITRSPTVYRDAALLASGTDDDAVAWLRARPMNLSSVTGMPHTPLESHLLEYILLRRKRPAINLALSQHGRSGTILQRLYSYAADTVKVVACSNASLFVGETVGNRLPKESLLWVILFRGPIAEVRAICENPHLDAGIYTAIIESWKPEAEREIDKTYLPEDRYIAVLNFLALNSRMPQSREESAERHYMDGFAAYNYNKFYTSAWKLAETAPVTPAWSNALAKLFKNLHVPFKCIDDIDAVIARWKTTDETKFAATRYVREALAAAFLTPSVDLLNNEDESLRNAFYRTFDPDRMEFRDLDWNEWIDRDVQIYFTISGNSKVWRSPLGRSKLKNMLWHGSKKNSDLLEIGLYEEQIEELEQQNPSWFTASEDADEYKPIVETIAQLRQEIRSLIGAMNQREKFGLWLGSTAIIGIVIGIVIGVFIG